MMVAFSKNRCNVLHFSPRTDFYLTFKAEFLSGVEESEDHHYDEEDDEQRDDDTYYRQHGQRV